MDYLTYFKPYNENYSINDKIKTIKENIDSSNRLRKEISDIMSSSNTSSHFEDITHEHSTHFSKDNYEYEIDEELDSIYNKISSIDITNKDDDAILKMFRDIISPNNIRFKYIIDQLKIKLYSEISFYSELFLESLSKETYIQTRDIILSIKNKIELLDELDKEEEIINDISSDNKLVFLLDDTGNAIVFDSFKKEIPREYYLEFKELLEGIKTGNMKNLKYLRKPGIFEVKDFKIRILFDRLNTDTYIILDAFMKKFDTSKYYRSRIINKYKLYDKSLILSKLSDPSFLLDNEKSYNAIISLLSSGGESLKCLKK